MKTSNLEYTSFLIRLWREPQGSVEPPAADREWFDAACPERRPEPVEGQSRRAHHEWLVQVEHIPGGEKEYFASLEALFAFIREQLPGSQGSKGAREQRGGGAKEQRRMVRLELDWEGN